MIALTRSSATPSSRTISPVVPPWMAIRATISSVLLDLAAIVRPVGQEQHVPLALADELERLVQVGACPAAGRTRSCCGWRA
jgi:hypothetical protein